MTDGRIRRMGDIMIQGSRITVTMRRKDINTVATRGPMVVDMVHMRAVSNTNLSRITTSLETDHNISMNIAVDITQTHHPILSNLESTGRIFGQLHYSSGQGHVSQNDD